MHAAVASNLRLLTKRNVVFDLSRIPLSPGADFNNHVLSFLIRSSYHCSDFLIMSVNHTFLYHNLLVVCHSGQRVRFWPRNFEDKPYLAVFVIQNKLDCTSLCVTETPNRKSDISRDSSAALALADSDFYPWAWIVFLSVLLFFHHLLTKNFAWSSRLCSLLVR